MEYYQYYFDNLEQSKKEILIAVLSDKGFHGFEENESELKAFISENDDIKDLNVLFKSLNITPVISVIKEINWNAEWESSFEPVIVKSGESDEIFALIRADFHKPVKGVLHDIVVTPKMSFGTGHHDTTHGMLLQMSKLDFINKDVIDFGTGTGVLAILAEKMGAGKILATDNDEWSIRNTEENVKANNCTKIIIRKAENFIAHFQADIILANINLNVITDNLDNLLSACKTGGIILLSGMLLQDENHITAALQKKDIRDFKIIKSNNWLIIEIRTKH